MPDGDPVCAADLAQQIDATLRHESARTDIAIAGLWWVAVVEPHAPVVICGTLGTTSSCRIAIAAWEEAPFLVPYRMHEYIDTVR